MVIEMNWAKVCKQINKTRQIGMPLDEAQEYELQLEKELRSLNPKSKALRYYPSVWIAIQSYQIAIRRIEKRRERRNKK